VRLLRFARNGEEIRRIASLRSQRQEKHLPDCFAPLAETDKGILAVTKGKPSR